ncbi:exodeoxyribonuclease VII large subunit [Dactylosporangium aurantiacum]|uniref:exodeoxyribonuclease VII large subunit n=1 Tax=Dactylosporangium aurantiacum TaxID=35754 RepID=UPI0009DFF86A|nr:exodeoxyribonuclease VII large subunit [Dactylosporangium aurantiacum]MDG6104927.1 exodeoxyribonuclease VII large subunit [Dactylosporangium aurantiacum]
MTTPGPSSPAASSAAPPATSSADAPWPVRVVSQKIGAWIGRLGWIWVDGQVAQITRRPGTNTVFLTLRDPSADLSLTVTTNRDVVDLGAPGLADGARIVVHARPEFYAARGSLSLRADEIRQVGLGELLARLEQLKKLLAAEGLFDRARKRRLPFLPAKVGLITGRASAAERDVLTNARRRWPAVEFRVVNVAVQGTSAVPQIIDALAVLDRDETVDVIVLARGGGSTEDLLPFSDEALCRAVFACRTPVVSAVGHETDVPLVDFVADVRASTPTDAAKRIVPDLADEFRLIGQARQRLDRALLTRLDREQQRLDAIRSRPSIARPLSMIEQRAADVTQLRDRAARNLSHRLDRAGTELAHTLARLRTLSPAATLQRGYAIVQRADGAVVRAAADVSPGGALRIRLAEGELAATATDPAAGTADPADGAPGPAGGTAGAAAGGTGGQDAAGPAATAQGEVKPKRATRKAAPKRAADVSQE